MDILQKKMINYGFHIAATICIALCFFFQYLQLDLGVMEVQCYIDYSSKVYCVFGDGKFDDKCYNLTLCKITAATPYLAALIIVLAVCAFVTKFMRQQVPVLGSEMAIYGVIGIEGICAFLAFLNPTMLLANMEGGWHSKWFPIFLQYVSFGLYFLVAVMDFMNKGQTRTGGLLD